MRLSSIGNVANDIDLSPLATLVADVDLSGIIRESDGVIISRSLLGYPYMVKNVINKDGST